jgi:hypothetical protein
MDGRKEDRETRMKTGRTMMEVVLWRQLGGSTRGLSGSGSIGPKTFLEDFPPRLPDAGDLGRDLGRDLACVSTFGGLPSENNKKNIREVPWTLLSLHFSSKE